MRVLLVDDSPAMRAFIRRVLTLSGIEVEQYLQAANGEEALSHLSAQHVDIVLTDVNMPVMDGETLVKEMHSRGLLDTTAVLVVSTDSTCTRMRRLLELGARAYLQKPFTPELLREAIEKVLVNETGEAPIQHV